MDRIKEVRSSAAPPLSLLPAARCHGVCAVPLRNPTMVPEAFGGVTLRYDARQQPNPKYRREHHSSATILLSL